MASLELRKETYRIVFMFRGHKMGFSLGTGNEKAAEQLVKGIENLLWELDQGYKTIPEGVDVIDFLRGGGSVASATTEPPISHKLSLSKLRDEYIAVLSIGSVEANTLATIRIHLSHIVDTLGASFDVRRLALTDLQSHVDRRHRKRIRGKALSSATLRKEIASFRACWNWGGQSGLVNGNFPNKGLRFPKEDEKPPFQTWKQIEKRIARGGLNEREIRELWECLFLDTDEIAAFLKYVRESALQPFLHPMCCFAAHTGARRSEMLRVKIDDVDFESKTVVIHEKKKSNAKRTIRRVPITPFLEGVLRAWLAEHPGSSYLFCQRSQVQRSKTRRTAATAITRDEAHDHLQRTITGSKWEVLKGWHTLRHSFISACASKGVDQRLLQEWAGHMSAEMSRRYTHLYPSAQREAINKVFT